MINTNKYFLILSVFMYYGLVKATEIRYWSSEDPYETRDRVECNSTYCDMPCPGSTPPPYCLKNLPECATGCICMYYCETSAVICFMAEHCKDFRRFLKKQPFVPRVTPENPNYYHF